MRVGIDLGTTRTIVAVSDRGNFPVVSFANADGDVVEHFPTVSACVNGELVHGHAALAAAREGEAHLRSWKRLLGRHGPEHVVTIGEVDITLQDLATSFVAALGEALISEANLPGTPTSLPEAVVSVPANAHSSQRFVTLEAFRQAGFTVTAMINEPSAAAIEFAHRYKGTLNPKREHVCVYDLGGGTFDAARVLVANDHHDVIDSRGVQELGGDDFDAVLAEMALEQLGIHPYEVPDDLRALLDECCLAKESIGPNTRKVVLDLACLDGHAPDEPVVVKVADFYARLAPLVDESIRCLTELMSPGRPDADPQQAAADAGVAGVYVVGGGSGLPLIARRLRTHFGRRVHRSLYPAAATAIGLAVAGEASAELPVTERFTRHFGVFRELEGGARVGFDSVFRRGTEMPKPGDPPLCKVRRYRARHNVGHFRYIECGALDERHEPRGDISPHDSIHFPLVAEARNGTPVADIAVQRLPTDGPLIEERFEVDAAGVVAVTISDLDDGFSQRFVL